MAIGKIIMEIAPSKENPRNSEGAFLTLEDGRIIFMYSRFLGETDNDDAKAYIALRESHDGGWTWSDDKIVFSPDDFNAVNIMSVSLVHLPVRRKVSVLAAPVSTLNLYLSSVLMPL
jgi:sialidase-1